MVNLANYHLTFDDEFSGTAINTAKWNVATTENQTHFFLDQPRAANVTVSGGQLHLKVNKGDTTDGRPYSTAAVDTKNKVDVQYGYIEASIKVPDASGITPAFWTYPQNGQWTHEVDIMEMFLADPFTNGMSLHFPTNYVDAYVTKSYTGPNFSAGFHKFGVEWTPSAVIWTIDGVERFRVTQNIPNEQMYLILSDNTDQTRSSNSVNATTPFPNYVDVDYVKVYTPNAPHKLSLLLSEDAYNGNAQFIVKVDGTKVGGPTQISALHSKGAVQQFDYTGLWGPGVHDIEVDFTNDAYGGTSLKDRNLYVEQVKYDGASFLSQEHIMRHTGAFHVPVE